MKTSAMSLLHRFGPITLWAIGMLLNHYPMFFSGFDKVPGNVGDPRFVNYLLEHTYRWVLQEPLHQNLWNPPVYFPKSNIFAHSDLFLGAGPFYWGFRAMSLTPETSFQICFLIAATLNFWSMYLFLLKRLRYSSFASAAGAFLFAFGSSRLLHVGHFQLALHFFTIFSIYAIHVLWTDVDQNPRLSPWKRSFWTAVCCLSAVAQLVSSFYYGWFLAVGIFVSAGWAMIFPKARWKMWCLLRDNFWWWCLWGGVSVVMLTPVAQHYLQCAREIGYQPHHQICNGIPTPALWWSQGFECWFSGTNTLVSMGILEKNFWPQGEHAKGLGLFVTIAIIVGFSRLRHAPGFRIFLYTGLTFFIVMTRWHPDFSIWEHVYPYVPAGGAIRALGRIGLAALIPFSIGFANYVETRQRWWVALVMVLICVVEQGRTHDGYSKTENQRQIRWLAKQISPDCKAFYYAPRLKERPELYLLQFQIDAMWASMETGVPTINGYTGKDPPNWDLSYNYWREESRRRRYEQQLNQWLKRHQMRREDVQFLTPTWDPEGDSTWAGKVP